MNSDFGFNALAIVFLGGGILAFAAFAIFFIFAASGLAPFKEKDDQNKNNSAVH